MDQGAVDTGTGRASATPGSTERLGAESDPPATSPPTSARTRRRLAFDLGILAVVGVLLAAAVWATVAVIHREFYSPTAFVERYLSLLAEGRSAEALTVPGVAVDSAALESAGLPATASEALLRPDALATLTGIDAVSEVTEGDVTRVTVEYTAGAYPGTTTFEIERDGSIGLAPTWRFATSPLAVMELTVKGSMVFEINGFEIDKRQISPDGADADPLAPVPLLVFSPAVYSISVDTPISATPGVAVLSDSPFTDIPIDIQAVPTEQFMTVVQTKVEEFLSACATQEVLQPTACPFGFPVQDRLASEPQWSIARQPTVELAPDGAGWTIPPVEAVARIDVDIRSLFDGSVDHVTEDVPFLVKGTVVVQPDGRVNIRVSGPDTR